MKVELFKKIIKEAVKEVLQEELRSILAEVGEKKEGIPLANLIDYQEDTPLSSTQAPKAGSNSLMEILNQTRQSMTREDYTHLTGHNPLQQPPDGIYNVAENRTPQVGLDLTNLGFVKNAGAILKASNEKDKQRVGA
jgi:hypothetical protein